MTAATSQTPTMALLDSLDTDGAWFSHGSTKKLLNLACRMERALDTIANKPIGHPEATDREVLDAIVLIARAALGVT